MGGAGHRAPCPWEAAHCKRAADRWLSAPHSPARTRQDLHLLQVFPLPPSPSRTDKSQARLLHLLSLAGVKHHSNWDTLANNLMFLYFLKRKSFLYNIFITLRDLPFSCPPGHGTLALRPPTVSRLKTPAGATWRGRGEGRTTLCCNIAALGCRWLARGRRWRGFRSEERRRRGSAPHARTRATVVPSPPAPETPRLPAGEEGRDRRPPPPQRHLSLSASHGASSLLLLLLLLSFSSFSSPLPLLHTNLLPNNPPPP